MDRIEEIKERIKRNKETIKMITDIYVKANAPEGYKSFTSYVDADAIHGSRKNIDTIEIIERIRILENLIYIDERILRNYEKEQRIQKKLLDIDNIRDKVYYLRKIEGKTQEQTAEILGITDRHVRRIEAFNKMSGQKS